MNYLKYTTLISLIFFSACTVSKDIEKPQSVLPASFRDAAIADTASIADIGWKQFFTDASLQKLIDSAIVNNYDMQYAVKNIEAAQLVLKQTKFAYLPDVNFNLTGSINRPSDNSLNGISLSQFLGKSYIEDYSANISLSWEADIWGKIKQQKKIALSQYLQTAEARKAIQTNIVANIAQSYYNLLMLDEQLRIAKKNVLLNDSTLQIIKLQYTAGQQTALAIQQADAQRLVAAQLVPQFEQEIVIRENTLSILTGVLPATIQRTVSLDALTIPEDSRTGIPAEMLNRRPDVKSYELAVDISNAQVGIAKANMYPSLSITAQGGINSFKASNWFNIPASLFGAVAGGITQPIFQRKQLQTQYELAKVNREKAVISFRGSVLNAVGEVSDALVKIEKLKQQQSIAAARVNTLHQAISNADQLFKNGLATYLEVITAQSNSLEGELELASLKQAQLSANIELYRSLGGGWR
ncbi:MAG: efflux transporter outer membrane subunit [Bacteroidetes bacterium]|nr:efflux transporter outer membrane subunit [Bacteroidota bacterium]